MADVLTPEQRRLNMSRIRGYDTKPEMILRRGLHARGLRFSLHRKDLPGCPDLVFPRFQAVLFVHGCLWHGHSAPGSRTFTFSYNFKPTIWSRSSSCSASDFSLSVALCTQ